MFLNAAADKLKKEQEKRKADLQRKHAAERRAAAVVEAQKAARAEDERRERAEEQQRKAEERAALELVLANNEGVRWESRLIGTRSDAAMQRGIRARADDKIVLPPSAWHALQNAGAASVGGHMFFEVSTMGGCGGGDGEEKEKRRTHAGVLGFDGVEGNVGLPAQVLRQLGVSTSYALNGNDTPTVNNRNVDVGGESDEWVAGDDDGAAAAAVAVAVPQQQAAPTDAAAASIVGGVVGGAVDVMVSYRRLPKGTYCKLQPRSQDFQGVRVDLVRHASETPKTKKHKSIQYKTKKKKNKGVTNMTKMTKTNKRANRPTSTCKRTPYYICILHMYPSQLSSALLCSDALLAFVLLQPTSE